MFFKHPIMLPILLTLLLAMITFWINQSVQEAGLKLIGNQDHVPDYVMHQFVTSQTDPQGHMKYVLAATKMKHFPSSDATELERPRFTQYGENQPYTQIHGLKGSISSNAELVEFIDQVVVTREGTPTSAEMTLLTDRLTIQPNKEVAFTKSPVTILQKPNTVIKSNGMVLNKNMQTLQLTNRVHVHYQRPKSALN